MNDDNQNVRIRRKERRIYSDQTKLNQDQTYLSEESLSQIMIEENHVHKQEKSPKLIRITSPFRTKWDLFIMLLAFYNCLTVPFFVAFYQEENSHFLYINTILDIIFLFDLGINFFTTYIDRSGDEIQDHKMIIKNYLKIYFWLDLVASVPIDNIYVLFFEVQNDSKFIQLSDLLKLNRILRLSRIIRYTRINDDVKATMKLLQLTMYLIIWVHLSGCIWFLVIKSEKEWVPVPDFIEGTTDLYESDIWTQYFTCFYHAIWLLTGGEVGPQNSLQAFVAAFFFIVGALITAVLFGEMALLMSNLNRQQTRFQEILDGAMTTMNNMKLPEKLVNKILDYITSTHSSFSQQAEYETFKMFISPSLQQEVSACVYDPIIRMNYILKGEDELTGVLLHRLQNKFTKPEDAIITQGSKDQSLFFLVSGECSVFVSDLNRNINLICSLFPGAHFGEISVVYDTVRSATVIGIGYCTIAELSKKDFENLVMSFPHVTRKLRKCTKTYHDPLKQQLLEILSQATYFREFPKSIFSELVHYMKVQRLERGQYLYKPGEVSNSMYILTEGLLELSLTINERHLHLLKVKAKIQDIEKPPAVPKKNSSVYSYGEEYMFDIFKVDALKPKAELVTVVNHTGVVGGVKFEEEAPEHTQFIGDYPQEIVIKELAPGTLLNPNLTLLKDIHQFQCKALRNSTVYVLDITVIENLCKEKSQLKAVVHSLRNNLKHQSLDYYFEDRTDIEYLWKSTICSVILKQREERKRGSSKFACLVTKILAIVACEEAGNFDLADKVMKGEIPPHYIMDDGTLDPAASKDDTNASLPKSHPIIRGFKHIFDSVSTGSVHKQYSKIQDDIKTQLYNLDQFEEQMLKIKDNIVEMILNINDDCPLREGKSAKMLKLEIKQLLNRQTAK